MGSRARLAESDTSPMLKKKVRAEQSRCPAASLALIAPLAAAAESGLYFPQSLHIPTSKKNKLTKTFDVAVFTLMAASTRNTDVLGGGRRG